MPYKDHKTTTGVWEDKENSIILSSSTNLTLGLPRTRWQGRLQQIPSQTNLVYQDHHYHESHESHYHWNTRSFPVQTQTTCSERLPVFLVLRIHQSNNTHNTLCNKLRYSQHQNTNKCSKVTNTKTRVMTNAWSGYYGSNVCRIGQPESSMYECKGK